MALAVVKSNASNNLSPARAALRDLLAELADVRDRLDRYNDIQRRAGEAAIAEQQALAVVEGIAEQERDAWSAWSLQPAGAPPKPRTAERAQAMIDLSNARGHREDCQRAVEGLQPAAAAAVQKAAELTEKRPTLVAAVLMEEAEALGKAYEQAIRASLRHETALHAIRTALHKLNRGDLAEQINWTLRGYRPHVLPGLPQLGGEPPDTKGWDRRPSFRVGLTAVRESWTALADRLCGDPTAKARE